MEPTTPVDLVLLKRGHTYTFRYQPGEEESMVDTLVKRAADPDCPLDWFDVVVLSHKMGKRWASEVNARVSIGSPKNVH